MSFITVVGLGLIGGSYAMALKGFENAAIYGVDIDKDVIRQAKSRKVIADGGTDPEPFISKSDIVIVCLYPEQTAEFIIQYAGMFKKGCVVTDVCGIKRYIIDKVMPYLDGWFDYVPAHPMAGKEKGGFSNADENLFKSANFLIAPHKKTRMESIELICRMALYMGTNEPVITDPLYHDKMIAYTSQLMHVVASGLMSCSAAGVCHGYNAGSFKDTTRVARINPGLWSELFIANKDCLVEQIDEYMDEMSKLREMIAHGDMEALRNALSITNAKKEAWESENR